MDKNAIASAFNRAAQSYNHYADFQRQCGRHLLTMTQMKPPGRVLDAGCGTGIFSAHWQRQGGEVTALDLSTAMLAQARADQTATWYIVGDIESLPLMSGQFHLCWSNLALQWCADLRQALGELYRVTAPGGTLAFSTLVQGSLTEMRQAWQAVDQHLHVNCYPSTRHIINASPQMNIRWQQQAFTLYFPDVLSAMRSVKGVGATCLHGPRRQATVTRGQLQQLTLAWPQRHGHFSLTYHIFFGIIHHG